MALTRIKGSNIADGTVVEADIADNSVTATKLDATLDLSSKSVTLASGAVTPHVTDPTKASIEALGIDVPATDLTGTIPDARFPATLPAIDGSSLTNLPAGGMWALINSTTVTSAVSSVTLTGITGYEKYLVIIENIGTSNGKEFIQFRLGTPSGIDSGSNYKYFRANMNSGVVTWGGFAVSNDSGATKVNLGYAIESPHYAHSGNNITYLHLHFPDDASRTTHGRADTNYVDNTTNRSYNSTTQFNHKTIESHDRINISVAGGVNVTKGSVYIYGLDI